MNLGLSRLTKKAEAEAETVMPEEKEKDTIVTCMSDCQYAQNPEKTCMLQNISLQMDKPGVFMCGQYQPVQEMMDPSLGQQQSERQLGLAGAKK